jgi:hypothetical protein
MRIGFLSMHQYNLYLKETKKMSYSIKRELWGYVCLKEILICCQQLLHCRNIWRVIKQHFACLCYFTNMKFSAREAEETTYGITAASAISGLDSSNCSNSKGGTYKLSKMWQDNNISNIRMRFTILTFIEVNIIPERASDNSITWYALYFINSFSLSTM